MFLPFTQIGTGRSGLGLGLSIARRIVELNNGVLIVRDIPGVGCVFTMSLPRHTLAKKIVNPASISCTLIISRTNEIARFKGARGKCTGLKLSAKNYCRRSVAKAWP